VKKTMMLFSDPTDDLKAAKRAIAEDAILKGADKAWKNGNLEMHLKYMKEYAEINRLSEDIGNQMEDLVRKMLPTQVIIISKSEELKAEAEKMQADLIEDIDHIEVNEKTEGSED
jgi:hypothetical protein